jgi:protocatechuate 3,4-dioxygenase beta subunit
MVMKAATDAGARDSCALTVTARPFPHEAGVRRFWPSHVSLAIAAAMLAPVVTVVASGAMSARRSAARTLRGEPPAAQSSKNAVTGRILDAAGNAADHASVRVVTCDAMPSRAAGAIADTQGRFRLEGFGGRRVRVVAENDDDGFVESAELEGDGARDVVLVLGRASGLRGVVLDERGAPVPQAVVKSWGGSAATEKIVTADDEGRYALERPAPNASRITVWARGFDPSTFAVSRGESGGATLDLRLRAARPIRGRVLGPTGQPVSGARIVACEDVAAEAAISDAAGAFELPATTVGCVVNAAHPRFSSARPTTIESVADLAIRLGAGGAIEGTVLDDRGGPVNSFSVTIESFEPAEGESQESSRAGESRDELRGAFRFDDLAAGTYVLRAATPEGLVSEPETIVVARGKVAHGVALAFAKPPTTEPVVVQEEVTEAQE